MSAVLLAGAGVLSAAEPGAAAEPEAKQEAKPAEKKAATKKTPAAKPAAKKETAKPAAPKKEAPKKEAPKKETAKKETPKKETTKPALAKKEAPKKETPKKATPPAKPVEAKAKAKASEPVKKVYPTMGEVEKLDPALDRLLPPGAKIEKLAGGFEWSEGPVWDKKSQTLLFSDVPRNVVFQWKEAAGTRDFLYPSGYTGQAKRGGEPGSNGLTTDSEGCLVLCEHGDRRVARLEKDGHKTTLVEFYQNRRLNSPNDLVYNCKGDLYFTDPPYGLEAQDKDPQKELLFNGVYLLRRTGELVLLTGDLTFPNGIALSPDEKTLYVAVSDSAAPVIMAYALKEDGTLGPRRVFFDAKPLTAAGKGLPDGLKVDAQGNVFATGPGGILVLSPQGKHLGTIKTGESTANCAWGDDGSTLYITADMYLCRLKTSTKGKGF